MALIRPHDACGHGVRAQVDLHSRPLQRQLPLPQQRRHGRRLRTLQLRIMVLMRRKPQPLQQAQVQGQPLVAQVVQTAGMAATAAAPTRLQRSRTSKRSQRCWAMPLHS